MSEERIIAKGPEKKTMYLEDYSIITYEVEWTESSAKAKKLEPTSIYEASSILNEKRVNYRIVRASHI